MQWGGYSWVGDQLLSGRKLLEGNNNRRFRKKETKTTCYCYGSASNEGSQAGKTFDVNGLFQNVCACTHGYAIGNILVER